MKRIPSLDGLRAISISLVLVAHCYEGIKHQAPTGPLWLILGNGSLGVTIFFVISGYLITTLLLREHEKRGSISLSNFYIRRAFRILPPFYLYVAVLALLAALGVVGITRGDLLSAFTFTWDYSRSAVSWMLAHTWSLSVEEQFYILWPTILVLLLTRSSRRTAAKFAAGLILLAPIFRLATHLSGSEFLSHRIYYMLHTRMDALMFGCLAALLEGSALLESIYGRLRPAAVLLPVFIFLVSPQLEHRFGGAYTYLVGYTLIGSSITMMMLYLVRESDTPIVRLMNSRVLVHIGVISYSIYIWQQLFLHAANTSISGRFPWSLLCIAVLAEFSHYCIERPFMRWRKWLERRQDEHMSYGSINPRLAHDP